MSAEVFDLSPEEQQEINDLLEVEPATNSSIGLGSGPDIPALREQSAVLVTTGKGKESIGVTLTHEQVKRLSDKEVGKCAKRHQAFVGSKTTDSLIQSAIFLITKAVGMAVDIDDMKAYQRELKEDYIINQELSNLAGSASLLCGHFLALANAALITAKHVDFSGVGSTVNWEPVTLEHQREPGRDAEDEVPGYPAKVSEHCSPIAE